MQNAVAQKGKLSKRSKQAWLHPGAEALWLCRKVQKIGLTALLDNICTYIYAKPSWGLSGLFTLLKNLSVYSLGVLWFLLIHRLYYGSVSWNSFFMDGVFIILVNLRGRKIPKSKQNFHIENLKLIWEISLLRDSFGSYANPFKIIVIVFA